MNVKRTVIAIALLCAVAVASRILAPPFPDVPEDPIEEPKKPTKVPQGTAWFSGASLTKTELDTYGNRAEFVAWLPDGNRPDQDWRTALGAWLIDEEPEWSQGFEELIIRDFSGTNEADSFWTWGATCRVN